MGCMLCINLKLSTNNVECRNPVIKVLLTNYNFQFYAASNRCVLARVNRFAFVYIFLNPSAGRKPIEGKKEPRSVQISVKDFSGLFKRNSPLIQNFHTHEIDQKYFLGHG